MFIVKWLIFEWSNDLNDRFGYTLHSYNSLTISKCFFKLTTFLSFNKMWKPFLYLKSMRKGQFTWEWKRLNGSRRIPWLVDHYEWMCSQQARASLCRSRIGVSQNGKKADNQSSSLVFRDAYSLLEVYYLLLDQQDKGRGSKINETIGTSSVEWVWIIRGQTPPLKSKKFCGQKII